MWGHGRAERNVTIADRGFRLTKAGFLILGLAALFAGIGAHLAGAEGFAHAAWALTALAGFVPLAITVVRGLLRRETGVDIIALLAIAGALALQEYLAGAVISVMLASG